MCRSSTEAEYKVVAYTITESLRLRYLLAEMGFLVSTPVKMLCDNTSAPYTAANLVLHDHSKHIKQDHHFVQERIFSPGDLEVQYVPTQLQLADMFTKEATGFCKGTQKHLEFYRNAVMEERENAT